MSVLAEQAANEVLCQAGSEAARTSVEQTKQLMTLHITGTQAIVAFRCTFCLHSVVAFDTLAQLASVVAHSAAATAMHPRAFYSINFVFYLVSLCSAATSKCSTPLRCWTASASLRTISARSTRSPPVRRCTAASEQFPARRSNSTVTMR